MDDYNWDTDSDDKFKVFLNKVEFCVEKSKRKAIWSGRCFEQLVRQLRRNAYYKKKVSEETLT